MGLNFGAWVPIVIQCFISYEFYVKIGVPDQNITLAKSVLILTRIELNFGFQKKKTVKNESLSHSFNRAIIRFLIIIRGFIVRVNSG